MVSKNTLQQQRRVLLRDVDKDVFAFLTRDKAVALLPAESLHLAVLKWIYHCPLRPATIKNHLARVIKSI
jgi:hypothetical protein